MTAGTAARAWNDALVTAAADQRPTAAAADPVAVLGRLLSSPRGDTTAARDRLRLLAGLLRRGGGYWRAEDVAAPDGSDLPQTRERMRELRKLGALVWDERAQAYTIADGLRVPVALAILAADDELAAGQARALEALVPFAGMAGRSDARHAPVWAMLDLLERDALELETALAAGPEALDRLARDRRLLEHASDMHETVQRLVSSGDAPPAELVDRAVGLLDRAGRALARTSVRMSRTSRDLVRVGSSGMSGARLRAAAADCPDALLAAALADQAAALPAPVALVSEDDLAAHAPDGFDLAPAPVAARRFPTVAELSPAEPPPAPAAETDPVKDARARLKAAPGPLVAEHLFAVESWSEAIRLHQGLVRAQSEDARAGRPAWRALDTVVAPGGAVARAQQIEREAA